MAIQCQIHFHTLFHLILMRRELEPETTVHIFHFYAERRRCGGRKSQLTQTKDKLCSVITTKCIQMTHTHKHCIIQLLQKCE